ncbi:MAG: hypothetical protein KGL39_14350 [Patescibacteria group bacterium]|nr:hypothetical protein [Patescibacteria group bacterium]
MFTTTKKVVSKSTTSKNGKSWTVLKVEGKELGTLQTFNIFDASLASRLPEGGEVKLGLEKEKGFWVIKEVLRDGEKKEAHPESSGAHAESSPVAGRTAILRLMPQDHVALMVAIVGVIKSDSAVDTMETATAMYKALLAEIRSELSH